MQLLAHLVQSLGFVVVALGPIPLALAVRLAACRHDGPRGRAQEWLGLALVWCASQMAVGLGLGLLHLLHPIPIVLAEAALLVTGTWWLAETRMRAPFETCTDAPSLPAANTPALAAFAATATALSLAATVQLLRWPTSDYDSWSYHLPAIAHWYGEGWLAMIDPAQQVSRFPYGWELLCAVFTYSFGEDLTVSLPNLLAWGMTAASILVLARQLGAGPAPAWAAALWWMSTPAVVSRLDAVQVDLALTAFFMSALVFGLSPRRSPRTWAMCLVAIGLLLATKLSGFVYASIATLAAITLAAIGGTLGAPRWRDPWIRAGLAIVMFVGGTWYLRNAVETGNPFGFIQVAFFGIEFMPGELTTQYLRSTSLARVFDLNGEGHVEIVSTMLRRELGLPFVVAATLGWLWLVVGPLRNRKTRAVSLTLFGLVGITGLLYWLTPGAGALRRHDFELTPWVVNGLRFGFPCLALAAVGIASLFQVSRLPSWVLWTFPTASALWSMYDRLGPAAALVGAASLVLLLGVIALRFMLRVEISPVPIIVAAALVIMVGTPVGLWGARQTREKHRPALYGPTYEVLAKELGKNGRVGTLNARHPYQFQGRGLARRVFDASPQSNGFDEWWKELQELQVDVLALGPEHRQTELGEGRRQVMRWLKDPRRSRYFHRVHGENARDDILLYVVGDGSVSREQP